jgi:hypothetical protein
VGEEGTEEEEEEGVEGGGIIMEEGAGEDAEEVGVAEEEARARQATHLKINRATALVRLKFYFFAFCLRATKMALLMANIVLDYKFVLTLVIYTVITLHYLSTK